MELAVALEERFHTSIDEAALAGATKVGDRRAPAKGGLRIK